MTTPLTPDELATIRQRADAATPGPWRTEYDPQSLGETPTLIMREGSDMWEKQLARCEWGRDGDTERDGDGVRDCTAIEAQKNAAFIAAARTDVPRLLDEVERLERELATEKRHWVEDDRDLNELLEANARLERENAELRRLFSQWVRDERAVSAIASDCQGHGIGDCNCLYCQTVRVL